MIRHDFADLGDVKLHYASCGDRSSNKLVVFLHGFPEFWYVWRKLLPEFGKDFLAVAPDMRGYNLSSKPAGVENYRIELLVDDIVRLAAHLGFARFDLVAHDWGGGVAWSVGMRRPEVVNKLVIINSAHTPTLERELASNPVQQKASQYTLLFRSPAGETAISANDFEALDKLFLRPGISAGHLSEEDRKAYRAAWSQAGAMTGNLNYYRASRIGPATKPGEAPRGFDSDAPDKTVRVPTLVIWGEKDSTMVAENLNGLEQWVPDLKVVRVPDGTHWIVHEQPERIKQEIRSFLG